MKIIALLVSLLATGSALASSDKSASEFQPVLEIKPAAVERPVVDVRRPIQLDTTKRGGDKHGTGVKPAASSDLPLIPSAASAADAASTPAQAASESAPMAHYSTMEQAAADGVDPLQLRETVNVLSKDKLSEVDERSILQVVIDEWKKVRQMNGSELVTWSKENPAVVGGLLAAVFGLFALFISIFKRR